MIKKFVYYMMGFGSGAAAVLSPPIESPLLTIFHSALGWIYVFYYFSLKS